MATATRKKHTAPAEPDVTETDEDAFEELEDDEDTDLEEVEDDDEPEEKPKAKKTAKSKAKPAPKTAVEADPHNSAWLAAHVTELTGETFDARGIRMLLRKLAKDGVLPREVGTDRARYTFPKGQNDPTVIAVIDMIQSGEAAKLKQAGLEKVKKDAEAKKAAKKAAKEAEAAAEVDEEDDEDEVVVPIKKKKAKPATAAAPAKARPRAKA